MMKKATNFLSKSNHNEMLPVRRRHLSCSRYCDKNALFTESLLLIKNLLDIYIIYCLVPNCKCTETKNAGQIDPQKELSDASGYPNPIFSYIFCVQIPAKCLKITRRTNAETQNMSHH